MEKVLFIVRGLPGSGKTTVADMLAEGRFPVLSADMFFEKNGGYNFDATKLGAAHAWCKNEVEKAMENGVARIFVANTFTMEKEINPYTELAAKYDYKVVSMIIENRHGNQNVHGVPDESLKKMEDRFVFKLR